MTAQEASGFENIFSLFHFRLAEGQTIEDIPKVVVEEAAQLVKHNSIKGDKMNDIDVVYTMWSNLHKTDGMEVGQVGSEIFYFLPFFINFVLCQAFFSPVLRHQEQQNFRNLEFRREILEFSEISFHFDGGNLEFPLSLEEKYCFLAKNP